MQLRTSNNRVCTWSNGQPLLLLALSAARSNLPWKAAANGAEQQPWELSLCNRQAKKCPWVHAKSVWLANCIAVDLCSANCASHSNMCCACYVVPSSYFGLLKGNQNMEHFNSTSNITFLVYTWKFSADIAKQIWVSGIRFWNSG